MSGEPTRSMVVATGVRGLVAFEAVAGVFTLLRILGEWRPSLGEYVLADLSGDPGAHRSLVLAGGRTVGAVVYQVDVPSEQLHLVLLGL